MSVKTIANLIPTMSAIALVSDNIKTIEKSHKKKNNTSKLVGQGIKNIIGINSLSEL